MGKGEARLYRYCDETLLITLFVFAGLGLGWLAWQGYKNRLKQTIRPTDGAVGRSTLLYFTGKYCTACKFHQTPIVKQVQQQLGDSVEVRTVDVTTQPELATRYRVMPLPTTVVLNSGGQVAHINYGVTSVEKLVRQLAGQPDAPTASRPHPPTSRPHPPVPAR